MQKKKIVLVTAESGFQATVEVFPNELGETLKTLVVEETSIASSEQVLICENGRKIEANWPLDTIEYHLFSNPKLPSRVFVFDRCLVRTNSHQPRNGVLKETDFPIEDVVSKPLKMDQFKQFQSVLLQTLPSYERYFDYHVRMAKAHIDVAARRIKAFEQCSINLNNQQAAVQAVVNNLKLYWLKRKEQEKEFFSRFTKHRRRHDDMLNSFECDLQALKVIQLHPKLKNPQRETLLDCVPEGKLRKWYVKCQQNHEQLSRRVDDLQKLYSEIEKGVEQESTVYPLIDFTALRTKLGEARLCRADQEGTFKTLVSDLERVRETLKSALNEDMCSSKHLSQITQEFEERNDHHRNTLLPKIKDIGTKVAKSVDLFAQTQKELWEWFLVKVKTASKLQHKMKGLDNKVALFAEGMLVNEQMFEQFIKVRGMPKAYNCCIEEIVKRRAHSKTVKQQIRLLQEGQNMRRVQEARRRKKFLEEQGKNLPQDFIRGLSEGPTFCEIHISDFDEALPKIDSYIDSEGVERTVADEALKWKLPQENVAIEQKLRKEIEELRARLESQKTYPGNLLSVNLLQHCAGSMLPPRTNPSFSALTDVSVAIPRLGSIQSIAGMEQVAEIEELKKKNKEFQARLEEIATEKANLLLRNENLANRLQRIGHDPGGIQLKTIADLQAQLSRESSSVLKVSKTNEEMQERNSLLEKEFLGYNEPTQIVEEGGSSQVKLLEDNRHLRQELDKVRAMLTIAQRRISWQELAPGLVIALIRCPKLNKHRAMIKDRSNVFLDSESQISNLSAQYIIGEVLSIKEMVAEEENVFKLCPGAEYQLVGISELL